MRKRTNSLIRTVTATLTFLTILAVTHAFGSVTIQLNAYDGDGENTHTGRLGSRVSIVPTVGGTATTGVTWSLSGAGSLSSSGMYTSPTTMPSNATVVITARANADSSVSASYTFTLINPVAIVRYATNWPLPTDATTSMAVIGSNFVPGTTVYVNGTAVPTTYQSWTQVTAKVWIPYNSFGSVKVVAKTPSPGGGSSSGLAVPIKPLVVNLNAFDVNGTNTGTAQLGLPVQFRANVTGSANLSLTWPVKWSVSGAGSISGSGRYVAPATMPTNRIVNVTATLAANSQIHSTYQLTLMNPQPVVNAANPTHLKAGTTGTVTVIGSGFIPGSQILVNGSAVATSYQSGNTLTASVTAGQSSRVLISVVNPNPGGSTSLAYSLQVDNTSADTTASASVGTTLGRYIQSNFIGFSHEWGDAQWYMGSSKNGVNMIYRQLVQNLINPGSRAFVIRVGGGTTDTSGYPTATTVTPFAELASTLPVHFTLGVNLGADNPSLAQNQASTYLKGMPSGSVDAIEIGNEPDNYAANGMRASNYSIDNYLSDFAKWRSAILDVVPSSTKFLGPAWGSMLTLHHSMAAFNAQNLWDVPTFSQHAYAEYLESQSYPDDYLLSEAAATVGPQAVTDYVSHSHLHGQMFRIGELNSIDDGGVDGISNSFASALWAIDTMFEYANVGADGVNWHGTSGCLYCPFDFSTMNVDGRTVYSLQKVNPIYYGLLLFRMATGNTARLLPVNVSTAANIKVWAMVDQSSVAHVVIINKDKSFSGNISISMPGYGDAQVTRLVAPSYESLSGVSIGGQSFDGSVDGKLLGSQDNETLTPSNGSYSVPLQPTSAVMLTLSK
ncbi:MAG TPA: glycosyl hydrolase family protein [Pseudacidobacterium sp.]|nr:glycosyl hydrolase family protein [Pseudacidobacterium sp.]